MRSKLILGLGLAGCALVAASAATPHPRGVTLPLVAELFRTSDRCVGCHSGVTTAAGEDVSIGFDWRASMMANSARDPYWQAAVRREVTDHPADADAIQDECAKCHMPMARATSAAEGATAQVFEYLAAEGDDERSALALDGVSCSLCHQIREDGLGTEQSFSGGFQVEIATELGERSVFGPFDPDQGRLRVMHSATGFRQTKAEHISRPELCASCHTLSTHALGAGSGAQLPEQMPYLEWRASSFSGERTCQSCHMPEVSGEVRVSSVVGEARENVSRHTFLGGNFFMLRMLARFRGELGVKALPQELEGAADRTVAQLQDSTALVEVEGAAVENGRLRIDVAVRNLAGHKLPTGYPSRRAWLNVAVRDGAGRVVFESGALSPDGSVSGNDGDADGARVEPHWALIDRPDQVQVYESTMADPQGRPTTGLLTAVRFLKDNRLLPDGFDRTAAGAAAAVVGEAAQDADFSAGGDRVRYSVALGADGGPYTVEARLWYQPIAFRWARNLAGYDAPETRRFSQWYGEMAGGSAVVLARDEVRVEAGR